MEELDRLVNEFKERGGTEKERQRIRDLAFIYVYRLPERRLGLTDEDASAILLDMSDAIERAIDTYIPGPMGFCGFIRRLLKLKMRAIVRTRDIERHKEEALLELHTYWETALDEQERQEDAFDIFSDTDKVTSAIEVRRMKYIFTKSPNAKRRFFILLCRLLPFLTMEVVDNICLSLGFDRKQTVALAEALWKTGASVVTMNEARKQRRNSHWQKQTAAEKSLAGSMFVSDDQDVQACEKAREFHKGRVENSNRDISRNTCTVLSSQAVADTLGLAVGTVSSACFYGRKMMDFCCGRIPLEQWRNVGKLNLDDRDYLFLTSGFWDGLDGVSDVEQEYSSPIFRPFAEFGIKSIGADGTPRFKK